MKKALQTHWQEYLIEAWGLGMFMLSACGFTILFFHPDFPIAQSIKNPILRRLLMGMVMATTAILLFYSPWGKRSGAHINPAVTLSFLYLERIDRFDAFFYLLFQVLGGTLAVFLFKWLFFDYVSHQAVSYAITKPGEAGVWVALGFETLLAFTMFITVLIVSNSKLRAYTPFFVGTWIITFITLEAPISGMSINPARTLASAIPANQYSAIWVYLVGPIAGMMLAAVVYREIYIRLFGTCKTLQCAMNGV
jgi:aquaporin Z